MINEILTKLRDRSHTFNEVDFIYGTSSKAHEATSQENQNMCFFFIDDNFFSASLKRTVLFLPFAELLILFSFFQRSSFKCALKTSFFRIIREKPKY